MNTQIYVTAKITVKKEKISEILALMEYMTKETNSKETGCISYYFLQNTENEQEFTSYEVWDSAASEANHWSTPHLQEALTKIPDLLETELDLKKWKAI